MDVVQSPSMSVPDFEQTQATLTGTVEMAGFNGDREMARIARGIGGSQSKKLMQGIKGIYLETEIGFERGIARRGDRRGIQKPTRKSGADDRSRGTESSDTGRDSTGRRRSIRRDRSLESTVRSASKAQREGRCYKLGKRILPAVAVSPCGEESVRA